MTFGQRVCEVRQAKECSQSPDLRIFDISRLYRWQWLGFGGNGTQDSGSVRTDRFIVR